jgi:hypothetical protein
MPGQGFLQSRPQGGQHFNFPGKGAGLCVIKSLALFKELQCFFLAEDVFLHGFQQSREQAGPHNGLIFGQWI